MCSKAEWFRGQTRWTGALRPSFRATASSLARAGNVELDRYLQLMLPGVQYAITPDLKSNLLAPPALFTGRGLNGGSPA